MSLLDNIKELLRLSAVTSDFMPDPVKGYRMLIRELKRNMPNVREFRFLMIREQDGRQIVIITPFKPKSNVVG